MKRRSGDLSSDELLPKQRIVRRKVQQSLSPVDLEEHTSKRLREIREEKTGHHYSHRSHDDYVLEKYESRKSSGDIREDKVSKGGYTERHLRTTYSASHYDDVKDGRGRDVHMSTGRRDSMPIGSPSTHSSRPPIPETFDYSLRVANIDYNLSDNVVRASLFKEFKKYGFVNIKVIGFGKDRHAYINFNRADDARTACQHTQNFVLHGRPLDVGWSRSTLNRFPGLLTGKFHEPRGSSSSDGGGKKMHNEESFSNFKVSVSERHHYQPSSSRTIRDISYKNSSTSSRSDRGQHSSAEKQQSAAVLDPTATRTLFVGNLDMDITERELRDIFSPYGRIESVDIKTSRNTAYSFVKFFTINDAINAKNELHGRQYGNFRLSIGFGKGAPAAKVWIGNITCYADVSEIRKELDRFGLIRRVDYVNDDNHCFVHFDGQDAAEAAVASLKHYRFKRTKKPLRIDLMQHMAGRDGGGGGGGSGGGGGRGNYDHFEVEVGGFDSSVSGGVNRSEDRHQYRSRGGIDTHTHKGPHYKQRDRGGGGGGRVMSEGGANSPQYTTEKFRHSYTRKRDRSPHMHGEKVGSEYNGEHRTKKSRNGFDAYEYHKMYNRTEKPVPRERAHHRMDSNEDRGGVRELGEREFDRSREREKKSPKEETNHKNDEPEETKSVLSGGSDIPPPPPTIPTETYDTALNLTLEVPSGENKTDIAESAESLGDLAKLYPVAWRGNLVLKNTGFPTRMHLIGGDPAVVEMLVRCKEDASSLRITQRLRLEPPRLDEVNKRMAIAGPSGHCILIALPGPTPSQSSSPDHSTNGLDTASTPNTQLRPLKSLVSYLKQKEAAGIVALTATGSDKTIGDLSEVNSNSEKDNVGVLHAFPPCEFSHNQLLKVAPNLGPEPSREDHIVVLLVKGTV